MLHFYQVPQESDLGGLGNHTSGSPSLQFDPEPSNEVILLLPAALLPPLHSLRRLSLQVTLCPEMGKWLFHQDLDYFSNHSEQYYPESLLRPRTTLEGKQPPLPATLVPVLS